MGASNENILFYAAAVALILIIVSYVKGILTQPAAQPLPPQLRDEIQKAVALPLGGEHTLTIGSNSRTPPAFTILLMYSSSSEAHSLVALHRYLAKEFASDNTSVNYNIVFNEYRMDSTCQANFSLPRVYKIRRNGQIIEYTGYNNIGQFSDWVLNEAMLF